MPQDLLSRIQAVKGGTTSPATSPADSTSLSDRIRAVKSGVVTPEAPPRQPAQPVDPTRELGPFELIPHTMGTLSNALQQSAKDVITQTPAFIKEAFKHPATAIPQAALGVATAIPQSFYDFAKGAMAGDPEQMSKGTSEFITQGIPAAMGIKELGAAGVNALSSLDRAQFIRRRAIQSILKPNKAAFDFGADPVGEVANLPTPSHNIQGLGKNVQAAIDSHEQQLQNAVNNTKGSYTKNTVDIDPLFRKHADDMIQQASDWNIKPKQLQNRVDAYLDSLKQRYGSTILDPQQILTEKRRLNQGIKFSPSNVNAQTLNALKIRAYRALDNGLDTTVPDASEINRRYSGLVEAKHLIDQRILERGNAPMLGENTFQMVSGVVPEVGIKTTVAKALKPKSLPKTAARATIGAAMTATGSQGTRQSIDTAEDYLKFKGLQ